MCHGWQLLPLIDNMGNPVEKEKEAQVKQAIQLQEINQKLQAKEGRPERYQDKVKR